MHLSWRYEWDVVATAQDAARVARGFEVVAATKDLAKQRWLCGRSPLTLELPVGHVYTLSVRARLADASEVAEAAPRGSLDDTAQARWASPSSQAVAVDLRDLSLVSHCCSRTEAAKPGRPSVASSLGAYLGGLRAPAAGQPYSPAGQAAAESMSLGASLGGLLAPAASRTRSLAGQAAAAAIVSGPASGLSVETLSPGRALAALAADADKARQEGVRPSDASQAWLAAAVASQAVSVEEGQRLARPVEIFSPQHLAAATVKVDSQATTARDRSPVSLRRLSQAFECLERSVGPSKDMKDGVSTGSTGLTVVAARDLHIAASEFPLAAALVLEGNKSFQDMDSNPSTEATSADGAADGVTFEGSLRHSSNKMAEVVSADQLVELRDLFIQEAIHTLVLRCASVAALAHCRSVSRDVRVAVARHLELTVAQLPVTSAVIAALPPAARQTAAVPPASIAPATSTRAASAWPMRLSHISKAVEKSPLIAKPLGSFSSKVATGREAERDFARIVLAPGRRIFLVAKGAADMRPLRFGPSLAHASSRDSHSSRWVQTSLREGLARQLREIGSLLLDRALEEAVCSRAVLAMSASVGVAFAIHVGLLPQLLQPLYILVLIEARDGSLAQARVLVAGFVCKKAEQIVGDRPESKRTPWLALLASPDLLTSLVEPEAEWEWEYRVREACADAVTDAVMCDTSCLQDAVVSGTWSGLP